MDEGTSFKESGFGLEGTFKVHIVEAPCHEQGHLQLDQVAQSPVQSSFKCFQGRKSCFRYLFQGIWLVVLKPCVSDYCSTVVATGHAKYCVME